MSIASGDRFVTIVGLLFAISSGPGSPVLAEDRGSKSAAPTKSVENGAPAKVDLFGDPLSGDATLRLGSIRLREVHGFSTTIFSRDNKTLTTVGGDGWVKAWTFPEGRLLRQFQVANGAPYYLALSADERQLAVGVFPGKAFLMDSMTGRQLQTFAIDNGGAGWLRSMALAPDGKTLATLAYDFPDWRAHVWDCGTGKQIYEYHFNGSDQTGQALAFSPDGKRLVVRAWSHAAILDLIEKKVAAVIPHPEGMEVISTAFDPDGKSFVMCANSSNTYRPEIRVYDSLDGSKLRQLNGDDQKELRRCGAMALSADGRVLATRHEDQLILWDFPSGRIIREIGLPTPHLGPNNISLSPDGSIVSARLGSGVIAWKTTDGSPLLTSDNQHGLAVRALEWFSNDDRLASRGLDGTVRVWDARTGRHAAVIRRGSSMTSHLLVTPDATTLITGEMREAHEQSRQLYKCYLRFSEVSTQRPLGLIAPGYPLLATALSPDGRILAVGSGADWQADGINKVSPVTVSLWDVATRKHIADMQSHERLIVGLKFSSTGRTLLSVSADGDVRRWDVNARKSIESAVLKLPEEFVKKPAPLISVTYSDDFSTAVVYSSGGKTSLLHKSGTNPYQVVKEYAVRSDEADLELSPNGQVVAVTHSSVAAGTCGIQLVDVQTGRVLHDIKGEDGRFSSVKFSRDGKRIAAATWMTTILIYDVPASVYKQ